MKMKLLAIAAVAALSTSAAFAGNDDDIAVADLPKAVTDAISKQTPDAKLISAEKEAKDGKVCYEVDYKKGDEKRTVKVHGDGTIQEDKAD